MAKLRYKYSFALALEADYPMLAECNNIVCSFWQLPLIPDTMSALQYEPVQMTLPVTDEPTVLPDFVDVPHDLKVDEGDEAVLKVRVIGQPTPDISWFVDDNPVEPSDRISVTSEGDQHVLVIHKTNLDDEGMYKCVAKSEAGKAICEVELLVEGEPRFKLWVRLTAAWLFEGSV